ncbi:hypothetical protein CAPTEDRAFT_155919 [Capitella teleta]|uniref:Anti-proliferative protein domain-containing protein n=1 Tax=Capitella teleta TaxID=283909 RepID=R7U1D9_CAPTE|nr:hypothetical protein CAPTEDRAFT_155919 [Capitella teleta]|eukprot:ELT97005.1 hypothetical protein CAPTEDRAFT_155919 [Capitella teleta]
MLEEIDVGAVFLTRLIRLSPSITEEAASHFQDNIKKVLLDRYQGHWYEQAPSKGQAYRCISTADGGFPDPVLLKVTRKCKIRYRDLQLPSELILWIDPEEVTCRFGERNAAICTIASFKNGCQLNHAHSMDISSMVGHHLHSQQADRSKIQLIMKRRSKGPAQQTQQQQQQGGSSNWQQNGGCNWQYTATCRNNKGGIGAAPGGQRAHWPRAATDYPPVRA